MTRGRLAFELAATIRHDGHGGIADALDRPDGLDSWIGRNAELLGELLGPGFDTSGFAATDDSLARVLDVRRAVRSLFALALSPASPSRADAQRLLDPEAAVELLNDAARTLGGPRLAWSPGGVPTTHWRSDDADPTTQLIGALGRSGVDFLTGPDRERLRACPAARCVRYFIRDDPRQTWCSPSCGNRERVNRHYQRHHTG